MKLQINTETKIIKIEGTHKISDILEELKLLLPKDSKLGSYEEYSLECNTIINNWTTPVIINRTIPFIPWNQPYYQTSDFNITCGTSTNDSSIYNIETGNYTTSATLDSNPKAFT